jgi:hypothetical protein
MKFNENQDAMKSDAAWQFKSGLLQFNRSAQHVGQFIDWRLKAKRFEVECSISVRTCLTPAG